MNRMFHKEDRTGLRTSPLRPIAIPVSEYCTCIFCSTEIHRCDQYFTLNSDVKDEPFVLECHEICFIVEKTDVNVNDIKEKLAQTDACICIDCMAKNKFILKEIGEQCCLCGLEFLHSMGCKEWTVGGGCRVNKDYISGPGYGNFEDEKFYWMSYDVVPTFEFPGDFICDKCVLKLYGDNVIDAGDTATIVYQYNNPTFNENNTNK